MNNKKRSLSNVNDVYLARIQSMPESTSAFVRSAQVISSYFRAIEEIIRNSILHGLCSNVTITINKTKDNQLHVTITDDGIGLEETAMRDFIGTRYCSSTGSLSAQSIASRGESLKAIADLCVEFRISSTHGIWKNSDASDRSRASSVSLLTAPSKKKRREYPSEHCTSQFGYSRAYSHLVTSEKIIQSGKVVSFKSNRHPVDEAKENRIGTGTVVQLFGLFHRCHVRQKQYLRNFAELSSTTDNTISENSFSSTKIKHCIQMLAAAFPFVNFQFYPPSPSNQLPAILAARERYEWLTSVGEERNFECKSLRHDDWWSFVRFRFCQMIGDKFNKDAKILKIDFYEDSNDDEANYDYSGRCLFSNDKETQWKVQGILYINKAYIESEICARSRQHELIFVNHRLLRNSMAVADIVQSICAQFYGIKKSNGYLFTLYITCPSKDVDLIIDDTKSYSCIRQSDRLFKLITCALTNALQDFSETPSVTKISAVSSKMNALASRNTNEDRILKEHTKCLSQRIVSGKRSKRIPSTPEEIVKTSEKPNEDPSSPFSDAFLKSTKIPVILPMSQSENKRNTLDSIQNGNGNVSTMQWTRSRLRALDVDMKNILGTQKHSYQGLKISKTMLSISQFIGQVDCKYILVLIDDIICAIDQHAADERIGLEKLESLLESIIQGNTTHSVHLSKMERSIDPCDLLKSIVLTDRQEIELSLSQMSTVLDNKTLLKKWYFDFDIKDRSQTLILKSLPGICDKVCTSKDFIQFIQVLSNRTSDASCCKPAFFVRALASLACRYAIMFGEQLNEERCKEIIRSLANCDLSFICAHGRPSIVPLLDINELDKSRIRDEFDQNHLPLRLRSAKKDPYHAL